VSVLSNSPGVREFPILCYVTDRKSLSGGAAQPASSAALAAKIATLAVAGIEWIQIREKDMPGRQLAALAREALRSTRAQADAGPSSPSILVNDRVDVALTEGAAGVHLGESGLPVDDVKRQLRTRVSGGDFLVGVSCHSMESAKSAAGGGADYVFFGPVFATPSKTAFGEPQGVARLAEICGALRIPVLAIGGISLENADACFKAGAAGIAAIRLFQDAGDPAVVVQSLRQVAGITGGRHGTT
jgi:thiamine-phosphate pyrophosphorylase